MQGSSYYLQWTLPVTGLLTRLMLMTFIPGIRGYDGNPADFGQSSGIYNRSLYGGYDAGIYSYLWSKVYSLDILDRFERDGIRNATVGQEFRHWILEPGNSQDGMVLL